MARRLGQVNEHLDEARSAIGETQKAVVVDLQGGLTEGFDVIRAFLVDRDARLRRLEDRPPAA